MLEDVLRAQKSLFETGAQSVLRGQENRVRRVVIRNGALVENARSNERGVSAKVYKNGVNGFASSAEYSPEAAKKVIVAATENAGYLSKYAGSKKPAYPAVGRGEFLAERFIIDFEQKRIVDVCKQLDAYIAEKYKDLLSRSVVYREDTMEKWIYTSDAEDAHVTYPRITVYTTLTKESNQGQPVELAEAFGGLGNIDDHFKDWNAVYEKIDTLYNKLCQKAEGVYARAGMNTVILDPAVAGMIAHEAVGHTVESDLVDAGSVAGPNLNKQVASELISIVDYANTTPFGAPILPVYVDDEGVKAEDAVLIENGILKGYMHDRESAQRYGVNPCGNARGWTFSDEPLVRMRNTLVLPGKDKLEDMIASVEDGYYLEHTGNGQADLTGEFMFGINMGYEIKNGKLGKAILDTTVSGVAFDLMKTVDMVADQVKCVSWGTCGKKQPMAVSMGGPAIKCKINMGGR
ncbi:MAG: TldD/PmbA family protein [Lachnospiraceae bacterium]|nr:TldD/PmbA family protein [Lachnospiraceae bacterium]